VGQRQMARGHVSAEIRQRRVAKIATASVGT